MSLLLLFGGSGLGVPLNIMGALVVLDEKPYTLSVTDEWPFTLDVGDEKPFTLSVFDELG